jgi:hypothetical protein
MQWVNACIYRKWEESPREEGAPSVEGGRTTCEGKRGQVLMGCHLSHLLLDDKCERKRKERLPPLKRWAALSSMRHLSSRGVHLLIEIFSNSSYNSNSTHPKLTLRCQQGSVNSREGELTQNMSPTCFPKNSFADFSDFLCLLFDFCEQN